MLSWNKERPQLEQQHVSDICSVLWLCWQQNRCCLCLWNSSLRCPFLCYHGSCQNANRILMPCWLTRNWAFASSMKFPINKVRVGFSPDSQQGFRSIKPAARCQLRYIWNIHSSSKSVLTFDDPVFLCVCLSILTAASPCCWHEW